MSKKRFAPKVKIKKGDTVIVIAGKDKGAEGEVLQVIAEKNRVVVSGINIVKKHNKPTAETPGGINEIPAPIHVSNLMLKDPKSGNPTKVGRKLVDGKLQRYSKLSGEILK